MRFDRLLVPGDKVGASPGNDGWLLFSPQINLADANVDQDIFWLLWIVYRAGAEVRGAVKDMYLKAAAQRTSFELSQQPFQTVKPFGAQPYNGDRVRSLYLARLDSNSHSLFRIHR